MSSSSSTTMKATTKNDSSAPASSSASGLLLLDANRPLRVACIGGGQLGRMMGLEAPRLGIRMSFLDPLGPACPAASASATRVVQGSLQDANAIRKLVKDSQADVLTAEIEHIDCEVLEQLEAEGIVSVQPSGRVIRLIQDKFLQKQHFDTAAISVPPYAECSSVAKIRQATQKLGLPLMLKSRNGGYDGRGNYVLKSLEDDDIQDALTQLGINQNVVENSDTPLPLYAEGWIDFDCEIAVVVVRSSCHKQNSNNDDDYDDDIHTRCYPAVNAIQQNSICRVVLAPVRHVSSAVREQAEQMAVQAIDSLPDGASGVFGVEMFVTKQNTVLLNEVAPRPHNTGHYTQDACSCSQFENHLRGVCGLPLGNTNLKVEAAAMVNVLGAESSSMPDTLASSNAAMHMATATVHWYGKTECRAGRKMGHINLTAHSAGELDLDLWQLMQIEGIPRTLLPGNDNNNATPLVGVIMGSQSDLPTMQAAVDVLKQFHIPYEVDIVSAHRTPEKLVQYSRQAAGRGLRVLIAGAGGAAHLPGMVASLTPLPVVGVPVKTSTLSGVDSLYSIVQMPRGVPVATVAIGNATNAGLLAVRILSTSRPALRQAMQEYQTKMTEAVDEASAKLLAVGSDEFLEQMESKSQSVNI